MDQPETVKKAQNFAKRLANRLKNQERHYRNKVKHLVYAATAPADICQVVDASHVPRMKSVVVVPSEAGPSSQAGAMSMETGQPSTIPDSAAGESSKLKEAGNSRSTKQKAKKRVYTRAANRDKREDRRAQHKSTDSAKHMDAGRVEKHRQDCRPSVRSRLNYGGRR